MTYTLEFKNGTKLAFEPFPIKEKNFRKISLHRNNDTAEGIWACFSDEGIKKYEDIFRSEGYVLPVILVNSALAFYPHNSWGLYIPVKLRGAARPDCDIAHLTGEFIFCQERLDMEAKETKKKKKARKKNEK
jgi:hypothetical protein